MSTTTDLWQYRESAAFAAKGVDLTGFAVEGRDGPVGRLHRASNDVRVDYVIVETGDGTSRRCVLVPAGMVERVDPAARTVVLALTREQLAAAPDVDPHDRRGMQLQDSLHGYYHGLYDVGL